MRLVVEFSNAQESLHRLATVQDYQTIDTDALVDFIVDCYRYNFRGIDFILDSYIETLDRIDNFIDCPDSYLKMLNDISNLIHCVLSTFEDYKIDQILNKGFTTITIVRQWRNNYVFEFT